MQEEGPEVKIDWRWVLLFALVVASLTVPFLLVREPPLLDYANHLAREFVLDHLHDPAYRFAEVYRADWKLYPYVLLDLMIVCFEHVMPVEAAGKLALILITAGLPVAVGWFLWQANRRSIYLALAGCALSYNALFFWGFTAYQLSVDFCFVMLGTWLWYRRSPLVTRGALFALAAFLTYFAHLLGFASAAFLLVFFELTQRGWWWRLRLAGFLGGPTLLFLWARPGISGEQNPMAFRPLYEKLGNIRALTTDGYDDRITSVLLVGFALCLLLAVVRNRELRIQWRWMIAAVGLLAVYLVLPWSWGSGFDLDVRLVAPLVLGSLATLEVGRRAKWIALVAVLLTGLRVYDISSGFVRETRRNVGMNTGIAQIERGSRVYPSVNTCHDQDPLDYYYVHYWAYSVIRRGAISPYLFDIPGQTQMRIEWQPYMTDGYWQHCEEIEPDWERVADDYDYIWSYGDQRFTAHITEVAEKVFAQGALILYRVRRQSCWHYSAIKEGPSSLSEFWRALEIRLSSLKGESSECDYKRIDLQDISGLWERKISEEDRANDNHSQERKITPEIDRRQKIRPAENCDSSPKGERQVPDIQEEEEKRQGKINGIMSPCVA